MGIINVLDFQIANLIAAGEVVERPSSAVKELLENAIDAGATDITVEIKRGGISFIRVSDNGCGISAEDLPVALKRHATSKIKEARDLDTIVTLGFRGEALAAISSVSITRIISKRREDAFGTSITSEFGKVTDISQTGCKDGTTVIVENLFENVPARRKFLKKDSSEAAAVISIVERVALSHPEIAIKLINNGNVEFRTQGNGKLLDTIYAVFGKDFASKLIDVEFMADGIEVLGYIGTPINVRANRNYQNFYINGRYVRSKTATAALEQAYESYLEVGKFPCCVLFINVHPVLVDVNVHPTKLEVKFSNEKTVFEAIYCAVRNALVNATDRPEVLFESEHMKDSDYSMYNAFVPVHDRINDSAEKPLSPQQMFDLPVSEAVSDKEDNVTAADREPERIEERPVMSDQKPVEEKKESTAGIPAVPDLNSFEELEDEIPPELSYESAPQKDERDLDERIFSLGYGVNTDKCPPYKIIGEAFNAFITVETEGKVLIIDKHAAHERILFEQMKKINRSERGAGQILLIPLVAELPYDELTVLEENKEQIEAIGYKFETETSKRQLVICQIPSMLDAASAKDMLISIAGNLINGTGNIDVTKESYFEKALYQASCKAATKAGWTDSEPRIRWIVESVLSNPDIRYCPHGRPIAVEVTKNEIEKIFKRI